MKQAKVTFKKTKCGGQKGDWRYSVIAPNGELLVTGEGYTSRSDAERGFRSLIGALIDICLHSSDRA